MAVCGYVGDVKVMSVNGAGGSFEGLAPAVTVGKHRAGVHSISFNDDTSCCCTVSKDGTWKLWDISVDYRRGGDPRLMASGTYPEHGSGVA